MDLKGKTLLVVVNKLFVFSSIQSKTWFFQFSQWPTEWPQKFIFFQNRCRVKWFHETELYYINQIRENILLGSIAGRYYTTEAECDFNKAFLTNFEIVACTIKLFITVLRAWVRNLKLRVPLITGYLISKCQILNGSEG